jgi:hypothetical protein
MSVYYYIDIKPISRSQGRTASGSAAYRAGEKLRDYLGETHDYRRKKGVLHTELILPPDAPAWARSRQQLWVEADRSETRKNSTVARECIVALPTELDEDARKRVSVTLAKYLVDTYGVTADVSLHLPDKRKQESQNYHTHILFSTRKLEKDGFRAKTRVLDAKETGRNEIKKIREAWQNILNAELERAAVRERVDCRSLKAQGIDRIPLIHEGPSERPGHRTRRERNEAIRAENARRQQLRDTCHHERSENSHSSN